MTTQIVPFDASTDLATAGDVSNFFGNTDLIGNSAGEGFPSISIKGKVFHVVRGKERTLLTKDGEAPASAIEVVIVKANPNNSKVFYDSGYIEGSDGKPTCFSNDGIAPDAQAAEPQAAKCAVCPRNQWGSKITSDGRKARECGDSRRIAVATPDALGDPMLLRVPAASLKALTEYGKILAARNMPPQAVVTKIAFDYSVAHPQLKFSPVARVVDPNMLTEIRDVMNGSVAAKITGTKPAGDAPAVAAPAPAVAPVVAAPAPAPVVAAPAAKVAAKTSAKTTVASADDKLGDLLNGLDFD